MEQLNLGKVFDRVFHPFWSLFYCISANKRKFEYSCFPFPLKINCVGCYGCVHNKNPFLSPAKSKGPYKVFTTETFNQQYIELFGKGALVELLFDLEKHNIEVEEETG